MLLLVVALSAIAFVACVSPLVPECSTDRRRRRSPGLLDYIAAVDEENGIKAADAVDRLPDGFDESTMKDNGIREVAERRAS